MLLIVTYITSSNIYLGVLNMDVLWSELSRDIVDDFAIQNSEMLALDEYENSEELLFNGKQPV